MFINEESNCNCNYSRSSGSRSPYFRFLKLLEYRNENIQLLFNDRNQVSFETVLNFCIFCPCRSRIIDEY